MKLPTVGSARVIGLQWSQYGMLLHLSPRQLRRAAAAIVCSLVALTAGIAEAVPVQLSGMHVVAPSTDCSPWCNGIGSGATALVSSYGGAFVDGQFQGGGAAETSAIVGGSGLFYPKTAAATATIRWAAIVSSVPGTGSDPFHIFFDWSATLFASHDAFLGEAAGGFDVDVAWYSVIDGVAVQTFHEKRTYTGSVFTGEEWDLGLFDPADPIGALNVTFDVGSMALTYPLIGVEATAFDVGTFDFTLRADDGRTQPVPEPPVLAMVFAALMMVIGLQRRHRTDQD